MQRDLTKPQTSTKRTTNHSPITSTTRMVTKKKNPSLSQIHSWTSSFRGGGTDAQKNRFLWFRQRPQRRRITSSHVTSWTSTKPSDNDSFQQQRQRNILFWIRFLFLTYYGSLGSLLPYLPVYYDSLGHGGQIIGLLGAVKPFTTFLVAPLWGLIADSASSPFTILELTFGVSLAGQLLVAYSSDARYITFMVFLTALFSAPVKSLLDSMVMDHLQDRSSYGRLRLWGQLGFGIGSSGVGVLLSKYSKSIPWPDSHSYSDWTEQNVLANLPIWGREILEFMDKCWQSMTSYKLLFFVHGFLSIPTWMCIQKFKRLDQINNQHNQQEDNANTTKMTHNNGEATSASKAKQKQTESSSSTPRNGGITQGLLLLLHSADALLFFFLVFIVGVSSGIIENFAYVRIREVGGTGKDMGLSRLVSSAAGAPMFWFSGSLVEALGADRVLVLTLLSYVTRFLIYAGMRHPWHGLPAEALRGVTFAAFWSTSTIYAHRVSPPGLHATMLMFLNAMYGGLGQSLGAIIGGHMQFNLGTVRTFLYLAIFDLCFVGLLISYLYLWRDNSKSSFTDPKPIEAPKIMKVLKVKKG